MMKLMGSWRSSTRSTDVEMVDIDLESGQSDSLTLPPGLVPGRPLAEERRRLERELILKYDTRELRRGEAWFLIETSWLDGWMAYILSEDDPDCPVVKPGPLTNYTLFDAKEYCIKKDLVATKHYRGVNPQVYALYAELYGTAGAKPIARWTLDIYATPVMIDDVREMLHPHELRARVEVSELNAKFDFDDEEEDRDQESFLYRCCCRCQFLVPMVAKLCCAGPTYARVSVMDEKNNRKKRKKGRRRRSYDDDDDDESDSQEESETRGLLG
ncbi:TPA: hypothetical protein N0F65_012838 [Lagenidium giganteum]|uniref:DUSP domain-containing protein n=1 Tax=Lagenidium giganteum TaxID=4803 RepID=A0AAV2YHD6_9STRA|nr:TPA: hypothetical protein N0F65_012838 [Lagenidium giganteum]